MPSGSSISSILPSQSLSLPSQISGVGPTAPTQLKPPSPVHSATPSLHSGMAPLAIMSTGVWGYLVVSKTGLHLSLMLTGSPSSTLPLQSLSSPSHFSGMGPFSPWQLILPPSHAVEPCSHSPSSVPHGWGV